MRRVYAVVEGSTEEGFVKAVLRPHLLSLKVAIEPIIVTTKRDRLTGQKLGKGGGRWLHWRDDLKRIIGDQTAPEVRFTTMFDLYGLPSDFPGREKHAAVADTNVRADLLEQELREAIDDVRLIPYLQRHEFEALVVAGLQKLDGLLDAADDVAALKGLQAELAGLQPEDVNDGPETHPSKRLLRIGGYQKTLHGPLVTEEVGIAVLRAACPRFSAWVAKLEALGQGSI